MASSSGSFSTEDLCLPIEVRDFGKKLYTPIRTSSRIKYSCFAVSSHLLVLGANTGGVYVFIKHPLNYINFIPNKERDIQVTRFSPDDKYLAIGSGCGVIIVWELNITHLQSSKKVLEVSEHRGSRISDMVWDNRGQQLFIGDNTGKISVAHMPGVLPRTVLASGGGIRLRKPGIILFCETPVVQLDYENDHLLVSCRHKSAIMNLKREEVISVGSQERDGAYGACFYRVTTTHPQVTKILSARPKARIWKASLDGKVEITHKLRDILAGITTTPIFGINFESNPEVVGREMPVDPTSPNAFKRIRVIKEHMLAWNANALYILNLSRNTITQHCLAEDIQDVLVYDDEIWVSFGDPIQIRCLSFLHYTQLLKSLSQLQLDSQISQIVVEFGFKSDPECDGVSNVNESEQHSASGLEQALDLEALSNLQLNTCDAKDFQQEKPPEPNPDNSPDVSVLLADSPQLIRSSEEIDLIHIHPTQDETVREDVNTTELVSTNITEELIQRNDSNMEPLESSEAITLSEEVAGLRSEANTEDTPSSEVKQSIEQSDEINSTGISNNSFDESSLPFPSVSRVKMTQNSKEGDLSSSWSPKLVRKRSKKERPESNRKYKSLSMNEIEITVKSNSDSDLFAKDIFHDASSDLPVIPPSDLSLLRKMDRSQSQHEEQPISEHISRSERKKKFRRDSKQHPADHLPTSPTATPQSDLSAQREPLRKADTSPPKTQSGDLEDSRVKQIQEEFINSSQLTWRELDCENIEAASIIPKLSIWLTGFVRLITSVPTTSFPASHTISSLTLLSNSPHSTLFNHLATSAMLANAWLSISFPNPLSTSHSSHPHNFFYLLSLFLDLTEVRSYLTGQPNVDRNRAYALYIRGLEDFQTIDAKSDSEAVSPILDFESRSFPLDLRRAVQGGDVVYCVNKFPSLLPWELSTTLFGHIESHQNLHSHPQTKIFLDYMEKLIFSAETDCSKQRILKTVFSTDQQTFITWTCLSLLYLPSTEHLADKDHNDIPIPLSHQLDWRYRLVWELIIKLELIDSNLWSECLPHFREHCFWFGTISSLMLTGNREEAIHLLLRLGDFCLIERPIPAWGYLETPSDWTLTLHTFLRIYSVDFEDMDKCEQARVFLSGIIRLAVRDMGCLAATEILNDVIQKLENTTNIKSWFPHKLFLNLVQVANMEKQKGKLAFNLLERLDEELWKQKPNAISVQFLSQDKPSTEYQKDIQTLETCSYQWGIRLKQDEFKCQCCLIEFSSHSSDNILVFSCGHSYHKICLPEGACTFCYSKSTQPK